MRYVSVKEIRIYNGWHPIGEIRQTLKKVGETFFQTPHAPLVDADYDGSIIDDVKVYLDGEPIEPESVDPDTGLLSIYPPPAGDTQIEASYFWHPFGDGDIELAVEAAEGLVEALTGVVYVPHRRVERCPLKRGNVIILSEPVISIESVKIFDSMGNLLDDGVEAEVVDGPSGTIRLKKLLDGPRPPWYLPQTAEAEIIYRAGFSEVPAAVKQAVLALASYNLLTRLQQKISFSTDYGGAVAAVFTSHEIEKRLILLKTQAEKMLNSLPRRVERV
ncbi:MAG: hypothetical protein RMI43_05380 [Candidatus Caldarchaeum sp.]|nr:hypothetical protein [Candidatus Caldarchaeum sp.]MDW8063582.1 hypothetical protein [Candidatus Caldarchaeum sp.]